jgi:hypothetical protein
MRTFTAILLSASLLTSAVAVAAENVPPLAPGKPAGVHHAELSSTAIVLIGFGVAAAIAIGVASSSNGQPFQGPNNQAVTTTV